MTYKDILSALKELVISETKEVTPALIALAVDTLKTKDGEEIKVDSETKKTDTKDGEYELEDGSVVTVADGVVSVKEAEKPADEAGKEADKAGANADGEAEKPATITPEMVAELQAKIEELTQLLTVKTEEITKLSAEKEASTKELETVKVKLSEVENQPADTMINVVEPKVEKTLQNWEVALLRAKADAKAKK